MGVCCASLKDNKALMKMGLGLVLVGHVNFVLGAIVHGTVLRHIGVDAQTRTMVYAISNIIAIVAGLMGMIGGITTIVLSKNMKSRILKWTLLVISFLAGLLATASALSLIASMVTAIMHKGKGLLTHCKLPNSIGEFSITYECPFDPTRVYGTTIILWVLLILMSVVELVFSFRCFAVCTSFLHLCPCRRKRRRPVNPRVRFQTPSSLPPPSEPKQDTEAELEAAEQHELLESNAPVEQSDWL